MENKQTVANIAAEELEEVKIENIKIGYVMPIAKTEGYPDSHWTDVMNIIDDTIVKMKIKKGRIVSDGGEITTIHSRIVNNLNDDDIIICDVSSRNPNVMFELGMRIAFDKPVIIIKDDATAYSFDSGTIEHIGYPKDLRHGSINKFQEKLTNKIESTFSAYIKRKDPNVSPILRNFGSFDKREVRLNELSANEALIQDIEMIKDALVKLQMSSLSNSKNKDKSAQSPKEYLIIWSGNQARINLNKFDSMQISMLMNDLEIRGFQYFQDEKSSISELIVTAEDEDDRSALRNIISSII